MELESKIEALLFFKGEPMSFGEIANDLKEDIEKIKEAINKLKNNLSGRGITLIEHEEKVMLGTPKEMSDFFEGLRKEELNKDLSKAALETLSIILYKTGVTRSEVNFIRGVNSGFILRMLEVRGLIEKEISKQDARIYVYKPTLELLSFIGVSSISELPKFQEIKDTLENKILNQNNAA